MNKADKANSQNADAYVAQGVASCEKGKYDRAIADFNCAIKLAPQHTNAYFKRAAAYALKGDHDRAEDDFNKAVEFNFQCANACSNSINFDEYRIDEPRKAPLAARLVRCTWGGEGFFKEYCESYNELVDSLEECVKHKDMTLEEALRKLEECRKI